MNLSEITKRAVNYDSWESFNQSPANSYGILKVSIFDVHVEERKDNDGIICQIFSILLIYVMIWQNNTVKLNYKFLQIK